MLSTHEDTVIFGGLLTTVKPDEHPFVIHHGERYYVRGDIELQDLVSLLIEEESDPGLQEEVDDLEEELDDARSDVERLEGAVLAREKAIEDRDRSIQTLRLKLQELGVSV